MGAPVLKAADVARRSVAFDGLKVAGERLLWVESGGSDYGLVGWSEAEGVQPLGIAVVSSLHAYGGGAYAAFGERVWYVGADDGQLRLQGRSSPVATTPGLLGDLSAFRDGLLAVREHDTGDDLVYVALEDGQARTLRSGPFLSSPRWHDGQVAWLAWNSGEMPWDSTELWVADLDPRAGLVSPRRVAGGPGISVVEPAWSPAGVLHFVSDQTGWWNVYRWTPQRGAEPVAPIDADCAAAPWEHGYSSYSFLSGGRIAMIAQRGPRHGLMVADRAGVITPVAVPFTAIKPYLVSWADRVALIASSPTSPQKVALVDPAHPSNLVAVRTAAPDPDAGNLSLPEQLTCKRNGVEVSITYYPASPGRAPVGTIVRAHSGPTYQSEMRLDWETQFFTSHGFAVADVDYRGSTGFGRAFRKALDGRWGVSDVEDCNVAAAHLITLGKAQPGRLVIYGASAGGYTSLRAVSDPDTPFAGAVVRSAVVDPGSWQETAPRFQRPHAAILASVDPKVNPAMVRRPIAVVHGSSDPVAPIRDAYELVRELRAGPTSARFLELEGVDHFPSGGSLAAALDFELAACLDMVSSPGQRVEGRS